VAPVASDAAGGASRAGGAGRGRRRDREGDRLGGAGENNERRTALDLGGGFLEEVEVEAVGHVHQAFREGWSPCAEAAREAIHHYSPLAARTLDINKSLIHEMSICFPLVG
jgi:hypothetical protein